MSKQPNQLRSDTHKRTEPPQQEINLIIEAFRHKRYVEMHELGKRMTVRFPNFALGWKAVGTALLEQGLHIDALPALQKAITFFPQDPQSHNSAGRVLLALCRYAEAENHLRYALKLAPNIAEIHYNLSNALYEQKQYIEAEFYCRQSLTFTPSALNHYGLAKILEKQGQYTEAETNYQQVIKIDPLHDAAITGFGHLQMSKGEMAHAEKLFFQALAINPSNIHARYHLSQITKTQRNDTNFLALIAAEKKIQKSSTPPPKHMATLHFALGKSYADIGEHDQAFSQFISGGKLHRASLQYDATQKTQHFDHIIDTFNATTLARLSVDGNTSSLPIFIVGMPRSGTTLTEQIIASHPGVHGAGELNTLMWTIEKHVSYPENIPELSPTQLNSWANSYVKALQQHSTTAQHITDKMPGNFVAIGLIHAMLPNAKIIHVSRHPLDNCLSCFTQLFQTEHAYSYDLAELGHYYADYMRLMDHWRMVLPSNAFLEVRYEDIVTNKEAQARRLIEYCGIEWNDACLDFYKNKRSIYTASVMQVRQPIYTSSVARWKPYEKFLDPLVEALGDSVQKFESMH